MAALYSFPFIIFIYVVVMLHRSAQGVIYGKQEGKNERKRRIHSVV